MNLNRNPIYLTGKTRHATRRNSLLNSGTVLFVAFVIFVNYIVFLRDDRTPDNPMQDTSSNQVAPPSVSPPTPNAKELQEPSVPINSSGGTTVAGKLKKGESFLIAMQSQGIENRTIMASIRSMEKVFDFRQAKVGDTYRIEINGSGEVKRIDYNVSPVDKYEVTRGENGVMTAAKTAVSIEVEIAELGCPVKSSVYNSIKNCGEDSTLASKLVDLLSWDLDFFQDVHEGDEIRIMVEKHNADGRFLKYGKILAGEYRGKFETHQFFWYEDEKQDVAGYYREDGHAVRKEFLKTPIKYTRISSGYSHHRYHPVLHKYKKHLGIDYAAPTGTPVWAVASGVVTFVGKKGASGNLVALRHDNGFTSYYAHLHRFPKKLKVGDKINQKQTVGYVGMTGRATGPHLHFALKHKERFVNPQKVKFALGNSIPIDIFEPFVKMVQERLDKLDTIPVVSRSRKRS
jgi:murein DD-endopeptidase MepM/ murein hydrolase activator NlpD